MVLASPSWNKTSNITVPFTAYSILTKLLQLHMKDIFVFMMGGGGGIMKLFLMILDKQIGMKLRVTMLTNMLNI